MRCYMLKRVFLLSLMLMTGSMTTSCSLFRQGEIKAHADPSGSTAEQIAYHKSEIAKLNQAINKERDNSTMSLQKRRMSEVRRSNNKIALYEKKIKEHEMAIEKLEKQRD